jgi:hypothetical protein
VRRSLNQFFTVDQRDRAGVELEGGLLRAL